VICFVLLNPECFTWDSIFIGILLYKPNRLLQSREQLRSAQFQSANTATMALCTKSAVSSQKAAFAGRVAPVRPQVDI
jgi:hypothetical protein